MATFPLSSARIQPAERRQERASCHASGQPAYQVRAYSIAIRFLTQHKRADVRVTRDTSSMTDEDAPPLGYTEPTSAWCVEYVDPREPAEGSHQVAAFTTQAEAEKLLNRLTAEGYFAELRINVVSVHRRVEDWEWDR